MIQFMLLNKSMLLDSYTRLTIDNRLSIVNIIVTTNTLTEHTKNGSIEKREYNF